MKSRTLSKLSILLFFSVATSFHIKATDTNWPSFRGAQARGTAEGFKTPVEWSKFKWKTAIPGLGHSCPVIWSNRLFVTTAVSAAGNESLKIGLYGDIEPVNENTRHEWQVFCLDKAAGRILWKQTAHAGIPKVKRHPKSSHANSTPATDGKHLVCFFGAEGLFCYDLDGRLLWRREFGELDSGYFRVPDAQWGFGSSPVIHKNMVIVQCDVQTNSFITALDIKDGREIWRTPRSDVPTWSTPTVDMRPERSQVIANGFREVAGYDLNTGKTLWSLNGAGDIPVPTPIVADDLIFITSAHGKLSPVFAIRANAQSDISLASGESSNQFIAWSVSRGGNYMQTPIVVGDYLYCCRDNGVVTCYEAKTGVVQYNERLGTGKSGFTASPVAADGKIYFTSEEGIVYVVKAGPKFEVLKTNSLDETCMSTPALSGGELFFRTRNHLAAISGEKAE